MREYAEELEAVFKSLLEIREVYKTKAFVAATLA